MSLPPLPLALPPLPVDGRRITSAVCPIKVEPKPCRPREYLHATAICSDTIRLDLYGEVFDGRVCAFVTKAELLATAKQLTQIALQA